MSNKNVHFDCGVEIYELLVEIDILQNTMDATRKGAKFHELAYECEGKDETKHLWRFNWGTLWYTKSKNVEEVLCLALLEGRRMINTMQPRSEDGEATGDIVQGEGTEGPGQAE